MPGSYVVWGRKPHPWEEPGGTGAPAKKAPSPPTKPSGSGARTGVTGSS